MYVLTYFFRFHLHLVAIVETLNNKTSLLNLKFVSKCKFQELKCSLAPSTSNLRTTLLDPCVNLLFQKMQSQIKELQGKLAKAEEELNAWSFTADSVTGKVSFYLFVHTIFRLWSS